MRYASSTESTTRLTESTGPSACRASSFLTCSVTALLRAARFVWQDLSGRYKTWAALEQLQSVCRPDRAGFPEHVPIHLPQQRLRFLPERHVEAAAGFDPELGRAVRPSGYRRSAEQRCSRLR